jgi:hypothetical protein
MRDREEVAFTVGGVTDVYRAKIDWDSARVDPNRWVTYVGVDPTVGAAAMPERRRLMVQLAAWCGLRLASLPSCDARTSTLREV